MTTIKSFTDLEQSKKLTEVISSESADMYYLQENGQAKTISPSKLSEILNVSKPQVIPCWSLAALLEQLLYELCDDDGNSLYLQMNKEDDVYQLVYTDPYGNFENIETDRYEHFVDACYEMILKLHKLNLL